MICKCNTNSNPPRYDYSVYLRIWYCKYLWLHLDTVDKVLSRMKRCFSLLSMDQSTVKLHEFVTTHKINWYPTPSILFHFLCIWTSGSQIIFTHALADSIHTSISVDFILNIGIGCIAKIDSVNHIFIDQWFICMDRLFSPINDDIQGTHIMIHMSPTNTYQKLRKTSQSFR